MSDANLVDELAEEFACRWRAGERPSVEEYVRRHPELADEIRDVLPAVVMMERLKPRREDGPADQPTSGPERIPKRVGEYRIIREIGRGGMGVVYEAEQETLGRRVAVKLLPGRLLSNDRLRERFRREAQAAARLHHTNIVPVFGVGEHDGQCYYVMQLIRGRGLDRIIRDTASSRDSSSDDEHPVTEAADPSDEADGRTWIGGRRTAPIALPSNGFALDLDDLCETVARIGIQIADALAYAHSQGILHRDVKPSNLLLDDRGSVWMTDFGVAKLVEEANLTQSGDVVGTLRYMPPERFSGRSDAQGDVYSLGVTLYELLALRPAFPETTPQHVIQLITQQSLPPPSSANPDVPTDLDTIVLKAIARDADQRYRTPDELAEDLRRFLDDRPILARRIGPVEQLRRWCRRNRAVAGLASAVLSLLVVVAVVSVAAWMRTAAANRETAEANEAMKQALAVEQEQREHAEKTSASALEAMNRIYDRFAPSRIVVTPGLPAGSSADDGINLPAQPVLSPEAVPLLRELLGFYEQLAREAGDSRPAQAAEANQRIGDIHQRLGRLEPAITAYRKALALHARISDEQDESVRIKSARMRNELGQALRALQRADESKDAHAQALTTLAEAPKEQASRPEYRYELARTYYFQSQPELTGKPRGPDRDRPHGPDGFGPGRPPDRRGPGGPGRGGPPPHEASRVLPARQAIVILENLVKEYPEVPEYLHLLACCYRDAPTDRPPDGPFVRSEDDPAVRILRQLVRGYPRIPDYRFDLCEALARGGFTGRRLSPEAARAAREQLEEAVGWSSGLSAEYPNVPQYVASHAVAQEKLGLVLHQQGETVLAEKSLRLAVTLQTKLVKQHPDRASDTFALSLMESSLARFLNDLGNATEAKALLLSSAERLELLLEKDDRLGFVRMHLGRAYRDLAQVLTRLGETAPAAEAQRKADLHGPGREPPPRNGPRDRRGER